MKVGLLITARLKSKRLPGKLMMDLGGKKVIDRVIDRAKLVKEVDQVVLCTSTNKKDDPLEVIGKKGGVRVYRGSEDDVLERLLEASKRFGFDYILSVTADCPLFSVKYAEQVIRGLMKDECDYVKVEGISLGLQSYGLKVRALELVYEIKSEVDTEIWGPWFDQEVFRNKKISAKGKLNRGDLRLTLDYPEDYELLKNVFENVKSRNGVVMAEDVVEYLDKHQETKMVNRACKQIMSASIRGPIDKYYREHRKEIARKVNLM